VAEHSAYHHGEVSLQSTIVAMAQTFVASNNINLLLPIGQFGTRNQGGKEAASARYIFTALSPVTRQLFPEADDAVLTMLEEEGQSIEPRHYLPTIPLALVNGAEGIGTGWSTFIPQHNPRDVVANIRRLMQGEPYQPMAPWYKGYTGTIAAAVGREKSLTVTGVYNVLDDDELEITELPIGKWTRDYKNFLEELAQKEEIDEIREYHEENRVHFIIKVPKLGTLTDDAIVKKFKLQTSLSTANCVLFDAEGRIHRYARDQDIMQEWFGLRANLYVRRKAYLLAKLKKEVTLLRNRARFIKAVIEEELEIRRVKKQVIVRALKAQNYLTMSELNDI
jgi:DNA topoisomerase-2